MRRISRVLVLVLLLIGCTRTVAPLPDVPRPTPTPAAPIQFPRDAGPHDALTEWWYVTGHLRDASAQTYGFEFTVFQVKRENAPTGYLAHFAVTDIGRDSFSHQARTATSNESTNAFPLNVNGWTFSAEDVIDAEMEPGPGVAKTYHLHLSIKDEKPPVLHHGGYLDLGADGGSYYYSRTRLAASGSLNGSDVTGEAWMDHQWGNFLVTGDLIWDWYSVQLADRTELMLYVLRSAGLVYGTYVHPDGTSEALDSGAVQVEPTGSWISPHTGGVYPSGWQMTLPGGRRISLRPLVQDQELYFPSNGGPAYWEGAVDVSGDVSGQGYVELTGYAQRTISDTGR